MTSSSKTVNGVPINAIVEPFNDDPNGVQRIAYRKVPAPELAIVEPDPKWPEHFQTFQSRILAAFGEPLDSKDGESSQTGDASKPSDKVTILAINHVGSTSVPGLPAKAAIDIDLILSSNILASEAYYIPRLEAAGFQFLLREPGWHEHRFLVGWEPMSCNLHVWGPQSPEVERHRIFRDWLLDHEDDRELYARTKRECAAISREKGELVMEYNFRKQECVREILERAFRSLGYLDA
jgi:GrpB-like predicted nucleotidyltransferase (UPF0157 family)